MFGGIPRLLYVGVDRWRSVLLIGVLLVAAGSGIAVVSGVPTQDVADPSSGGTITVEQRHFARAVDDASVYAPGEELRGKSLYLLADAPTVTVQEIVRATGGPRATATVETRLVYQVRYSDSEVYRDSGTSARGDGTISDGNVTVALGLDMTRVRDRLDGLREEFGGETSVRPVLVTRVEYGPESSGSIVSRTPITFTSRGYHVPATTERRQYGGVEAGREPVPERTTSVGGVVVGHVQLVGLLLVLIGLVASGASWGYLRQVTDADRAALYREVLHRRFAELFATVESGACPAVDREMESLQDLVFVGEDGREPVLYFPHEDRYVVQSDGTVYGYRFDR